MKKYNTIVPLLSFMIIAACYCAEDLSAGFEDKIAGVSAKIDVAADEITKTSGGLDLKKGPHITYAPSVEQALPVALFNFHAAFESYAYEHCEPYTNEFCEIYVPTKSEPQLLHGYLVLQQKRGGSAYFYTDAVKRDALERCLMNGDFDGEQFKIDAPFHQYSHFTQSGRYGEWWLQRMDDSLRLSQDTWNYCYPEINLNTYWQLLATVNNPEN